MVIHVVGASGYVGRNLVRSLHAAGRSVIALSRTNPNIEGVEWRKFDALNLEDVGNAGFAGQTVVNCAAVTEDGQYPAEAFAVNSTGALNLAKATTSGKLIHISSSSIYDLHTLNSVTQEEDYFYSPGSALNTYSRTKSMAENLLSKKDHNTKIISLRPHGVYGRDDTTLLPRIIKRVRWVKKGQYGILLLPNGGKAIHRLTHIDNLVNAVELALDYHPAHPFTAFNVGDKEPVILADAIRAYVKDSYPDLKSLNIMGPPTDVLMGIAALAPRKLSPYELSQVGRDRVYDIRKAENLLGYEPSAFKVL